jgi:hypothetical protein
VGGEMVKMLNADLPSDWSVYDYLVMDVNADTLQRFEFRAFTAQGKRRLLIQPFGHRPKASEAGTSRSQWG